MYLGSSVVTDSRGGLFQQRRVIIDFSSGICVSFPTHDTYLLKAAPRLENETTVDKELIISSPKLSSNNAVSSIIPNDPAAALREGLRHSLPRVCRSALAGAITPLVH
jgi:hypothetical protein